MSVSLDATLQARMDSNLRQPLIELISTQYNAAIPFEGRYLNDLSTTEGDSTLTIDTQGRVVGAYVRGSGFTADLYFVYTDTDRLSFTEVLAVDNFGAYDPCVVPLADGNIAIIYTKTFDIYKRTFSPTGVQIEGETRIHDFTTSSWTGTPYAILLSDDSYLMAVAYQSNADSNYYIVTFTSSDFITWSTPSALTLTGLDASLKKEYVALAQATGGDIILAFDNVDEELEDGSQIINIYTMVSADGGATWSAPEKITDYDLYGTVGYHPDLSAGADGTVTVSYTEKKNVLTMDGDADGFIQNLNGWCIEGRMSAAEIQYDSTNDKLYVSCVYTYVGTKALCAVVVIDVPTWTIDKCYTDASIPAYNSIFSNSHVWWDSWISTGDHTCVGTYGGKTIMVIHHDTETITTYQINDDNETYTLTANVDVDFGGYNATLRAAWLDGGTERLYLYFQAAYYYHHAFYLGYIDIHDEADPVSGKYQYHPIIDKDRTLTEVDLRGFHYMHVVPEMDYVILAYDYAGVSSWRGNLLIYHLSSGGLVKHYNSDDYAGFHFYGCQYPIYFNGHVYGGTTYLATSGHGDRYGLMDINLLTDEIQYIRPSFVTADNYGLNRKKYVGDGKILMDSRYGPCIYDTVAGTWELFSDETLPGLPTNDFQSFDYDPITETIFAASPFYPTSSPYFDGIAAWNLNGAFLQGQYATAEKDAVWDFPTFDQLTEGHFDFENSIAVDAENSLWSYWTRQDDTEYSIEWDKDGAALDLTDYVLRGKEVTVEWHIDGVNKLSFELSHGHLFDPMNTLSSLAKFLEKGRKIQLRLGELIGGVEYWVNQGTNVVMSTKVNHQKGDYPTVQVECEDYRSIWGDNQIPATAHFDDLYPEYILEELITTHGGLESADLDIPTLTHRHTLYCQFIDDDLESIVQDILDHFQCFALVDSDGKFTVREIDLAASVDHAYSDLTSVLTVSPDDSYSNYINRVVVTGEGRYFLEVLYEKEAVGSLSGTTGWWGKKITERVWYSEDHERTCRDPELAVIESIKDFRIFLIKGGGDEYISDVDDEEKWVEITIEAPNLVGAAIALAVAAVTVGTVAIPCKINCGKYIYALSVILSALFYILGAIASYNYQIYARPIGHEKQTFQAEANDYELQRRLGGQIQTQKIDDEFCYTVQECQRVADYELGIAKAQRTRLDVEKVGHLQDEVGDMLTLPHPYTGTILKMFVTDLVRTYEMPESGSDTGVGLKDKLTGWRLTSS